MTASALLPRLITSPALPARGPFMGPDRFLAIGDTSGWGRKAPVVRIGPWIGAFHVTRSATSTQTEQGPGLSGRPGTDG
ncbi:hypothetical protein GCM10010327_42180 [Streptomyces nitrosporeus]|nr:hypothetical protein GCM10010327_42180 [Streptomyces nitrosporeus]